MTINQQVIEEMARDAIEQRVKEIENTLYFMNTKQFLSYVNMSWNTANDVLLSDPEFDRVVIRLGNKFLYNKRELDAYLDKFFIAVLDNGGDISKYKRR